MSMSIITSSFTMMKSLLSSFNESIIPETGINEESSESRINFEESVENISAVNIPDFLEPGGYDR